MERWGITAEKGDINRQIAADNKLLKEIKAHATWLYNWTKEQEVQPQPQEGVVFYFGSTGRSLILIPARKIHSREHQGNQSKHRVIYFLQKNGIATMERLYERGAAVNSDYCDLNCGIRFTKDEIAEERK